MHRTSFFPRPTRREWQLPITGLFLLASIVFSCDDASRPPSEVVLTNLDPNSWTALSSAVRIDSSRVSADSCDDTLSEFSDDVTHVLSDSVFSLRSRSYPHPLNPACCVYETRHAAVHFMTPIDVISSENPRLEFRLRLSVEGPSGSSTAQVFIRLHIPNQPSLTVFSRELSGSGYNAESEDTLSVRLAEAATLHDVTVAVVLSTDCHCSSAPTTGGQAAIEISDFRIIAER